MSIKYFFKLQNHYFDQKAHKKRLKNTHIKIILNILKIYLGGYTWQILPHILIFSYIFRNTLGD